jgi:hypothetical protein
MVVGGRQQRAAVGGWRQVGCDGGGRVAAAGMSQ